MMWRSIVLPTPLLRMDGVVCIDFTSPWSRDSRFSAPTPRRASSSQIVQKLMSGDCLLLMSKACALPGAVAARALVRYWPVISLPGSGSQASATASVTVDDALLYGYGTTLTAETGTATGTVTIGDFIDAVTTGRRAP